ncbi:hypothetical protein AAFF_G00262260 [Aldrovandia affinis]|uniref:Uncharacterized protein n=1 Tax=Aldrovandia affinis TaxID=143900 RepID=A0AAD7WT28_9TELE|nr:hypothetical protein AAFF_G00262260 [Aldrovandia affinis]
MLFYCCCGVRTWLHTASGTPVQNEEKSRTQPAPGLDSVWRREKRLEGFPIMGQSEKASPAISRRSEGNFYAGLLFFGDVAHMDAADRV